MKGTEFEETPMTMLYNLAVLGAMAAVMVSAPSCAERHHDGSFGGDTKHVDKTFAVAAGGALKLRVDAGNVRVKASDGNSVVLSVDIRGRARDVERFDVNTSQSGNDVEVRGEFRNKGGWNNTENFDANWVLTVPKEYRVEVETAGGDVEVVGTTGDVRGGTSGGNVRVSDIRGAVRLETSGGDVQAENIAGKVDLSTSGGSVKAKSIVGDAKLETSGGDVSADNVDGDVQAETSGGNVYVKLTSVNKGVHAETSGGNIELVVSKSIGADVDLSTSGGEVVCDIPVTVQGKIAEDEVRGKLNGGGQRLFAHTSGGNVHLRAN